MVSLDVIQTYKCFFSKRIKKLYGCEFAFFFAPLINWKWHGGSNTSYRHK